MTPPANDKKMKVRVEGKTLILERVFDAPRTLTFQAFSTEEHLKNWFGPKSWPITVSSLDFRPGGSWHFCMKCDDESQEYYGQESWSKVTYQEIVEPERIVYVDAFSDPEGNVVEGMPQSRVAMSFYEQDGKTRLVCETTYATAEDVQKVLDMGMIQGIESTWDNLEEFLLKAQG